LILVWERSDRVCGKRVKSLAPIVIEAMEWHEHLKLPVEFRLRLLSMSAYDRWLAAGSRRFESLGAGDKLSRLNASVRLFVNYFQPAFKLSEKQRDGVAGAQAPL
jgi:hypothetical protein